MSEEVFDCDACGDCFPEEEMVSILIFPGTRMLPDEYANICGKCNDEVEENR